MRQLNCSYLVLMIYFHIFVDVFLERGYKILKAGGFIIIFIVGRLLKFPAITFQICY